MARIVEFSQFTNTVLMGDDSLFMVVIVYIVSVWKYTQPFWFEYGQYGQRHPIEQAFREGE